MAYSQRWLGKYVLCLLLPVFLFVLTTGKSVGQSSGRPSKVVIYYMPFNLGTFAGETAADIQTSSYTKTFASEREASQVLHWVYRKYRPSRCDKFKIRLLIKDDRVRLPILVDSEGNVCIGKKEYAIRPSDFISLYQNLSEIFPHSLDYRKAYQKAREAQDGKPGR